MGPHQLVSFLRRSPDPLLQLVRADRLEKAKSGPGDLDAVLNGGETWTVG